MADKKKAEAPAKPETPKVTDARLVAGAEIDAETAQREANVSLAKTVKVKADPQGDIDERMAALLKDHKAMGARP